MLANNGNKNVYHIFYITTLTYCGIVEPVPSSERRTVSRLFVFLFYKKRKKSAKKKSKNSLSIIAVNLHTHKQLTCLANLRKRNEYSKSSQGKFFISESHLIELKTCSINYP